MLNRLHNLLTLRGTLSEIIAYEIFCSWKWRYSYEQCLEWFNTMTLDRECMALAISTWKNHWLTEECRGETIDKAAGMWPNSKQRQFLRSAFKTHVRWQYGSYNVAKAFLKFPKPDLNRIVIALEEYKQSERYSTRVADSRPREARHDADTVAPSVNLIERARRLREEFMTAHKHANGTWVLRPPTEETMVRYHTGRLLHEANHATWRSGYGAIRNERGVIVEMLRPTAFEDGVDDGE